MSVAQHISMNEHPHIFINNGKSDISFSQRPTPITPELPARNVQSHAGYLTNRFNDIWEEASRNKRVREAASIPTKDGFYIEFKSQPGYDLTTKSLESIKHGIRLLNIRKLDNGSGLETYATVFVPASRIGHFTSKIRDYAQSTAPSGKPKNNTLVASIEDVISALRLESFWQDSVQLMPSNEPVWCEAWLSYSNSEILSTRQEFHNACAEIGVEYRPEQLVFPERIVILIKADYSQLIELIERNSSIAEFRRAQEAASFWMEQRNFEQLEWVRDLSQRLEVRETGVVITILDSGVNNGHLLLQPILESGDCLSCDPAWGVNDTNRFGHGTLMSGLAAYGNLIEKLQHNLPVEISHRLESVKILPPNNYNPNPIELWGYITSQAVSLTEINHPNRNRVICMAVTSTEGTDLGRPSSWSAAIDSITSGAEDQQKRLFIISAGNVLIQERNQYPEANLGSSVQSPAQSWNALTIGAFTNKIQVNDTNYKDYESLAQAGCLSPFSTTSVCWEDRWPIKPDVVMEGGNLIIAPDGTLSEHEDLSHLTTSNSTTSSQFKSINMTSAATAEASWFAAQLMAKYPEAWPETIRGLIIHSAEWTESMISQFDINLKRKREVTRLLRTCGYGVPNLTNALNSLNNSLTIIAQEEIQPFSRRESGSGIGSKDMHLFELPWPREQLENLGNEEVEVKITLSYFIEPGPGEIGWQDRYRYASHGLRFDFNTPTESKDDFIKRINAGARADDESITNSSDSERWLIGKNSRNHGSVHSDVIRDTAVNIAACRYIGIYPVIGWWRERTNLRRYDSSTRYSLIISIKTASNEVDLYTPVINMIAPETTIST
jgi:hypothetical protein